MTSVNVTLNGWVGATKWDSESVSMPLPRLSVSSSSSSNTSVWPVEESIGRCSSLNAESSVVTIIVSVFLFSFT